MRFIIKISFTVLAALAYASPLAAASAPPKSVVKVVNGNNSASADIGWVIFRGVASAPSLRRYVVDGTGNLTASGTQKLKTKGLGQNNAGLLFDVGGVVFAPCPVVGNPSKCAPSGLGVPGVGLGFGQLTFGGAGSQAGGWLTDAALNISPSNVDQNPGSISAVAAHSVNGAFAVGWDQSAPSNTNHAFIMTLNNTTKSFLVTSKTDLGTLGGSTSQAFGISRNALHVVGIAADAQSKDHAVYAASTATQWTDITTGFPSEVIKSRALAANDNGLIAGSATVKRNNKSVDIGFIYDINHPANTVFFERTGANVIPLKILNDGRVVGNLVLQSATTVKEQHPFMYDGTLHDYGVMSSTFGCRVNKPNNLGELVGTCTKDGSTPYGVTGVAFYLDTNAATPAFIDLNATLHANANVSIPSIKTYIFGVATSIDDLHEIVFMGTKTRGDKDRTAIFLASKQAYNP